MSDPSEPAPASREPGGAAVVVMTQSPSGRRFLILHRGPDDTHYVDEGDWAWGPPSGCREPDEDIAACAARELHEETGLRAEPIPVAMRDIGWAVFCHEVPWGTKIQLHDGEHDRYAWVSFDEALARCRPETVADGIRLAVEHHLRMPR